MIKELEISKIDKVMRIWLEENMKTHDFVSQNYWKENYNFVKNILPESNVLIYEEEGDVKGFIGIMDKSYIAGLFVSEEYQSEGIGSQLIERSKEYYPILKLDVYARNVRAINFYKKHGFKIEQEKENQDTKEIEYSMIWRRKIR
ncbi:N-acetyltransferase [Tissierella praeacuta]|uniref:N-acetyltransferase n=1 Tax=Tissierella praeacuta TaxID=43131 RepID=UPI00333F2466